MPRLRARVVALIVCSCAVVGDVSVSANSSRSIDGQAAPRPAGRVLGVALNADGSPVPSARLRLRNLLSARTQATTLASEIGRFSFDALAPAAYLVELVDEKGKVRAVGQSFRIEGSETVTTFVRLTAPRPWFAAFFHNAAAAVIAVASSAGITAIGTGAPAVSPQ